MSPHADWHTDEFPELRSGPPWVMEEMIASEPALAVLIASQAEVAGRIATAVRTAAGRGDPVVVTGCGTSEHGSMAVAEQVEEALRDSGLRGGMVESRQAFEAALDPRPGGVCLGISHEGGTAATVAALRSAREAGATTCLVTARPESDAARAAEHVLHTPLVDRSWCHTVGYMSPILAGGTIAAAIRGHALDGTAAEALMAAALETAIQVSALAGALHGIAHLVVSGSGADRIAARETALKVEEGVGLPATARDLETALHGHLVACDRTTGLVLFLTDPRGRGDRASRGEQLLRAAGRIGVRTAAVVTEDVDRALANETTSAGRVIVPESARVAPSLSSLVATAIVLQQLTVALVHGARTNPDLIRREEGPYREAAELAESAFPLR